VPDELISTHENTFSHYVRKRNHKWVKLKSHKGRRSRKAMCELALSRFYFGRFWRFLGTLRVTQYSLYYVFGKFWCNYMIVINHQFFFF